MFNILKISRKNTRKKVWFSNQVLSVSKMKKLSLFSDSKTRMFVLSEYIYIISSYFIFVEPLRLKQKKSGSVV